MKNRKWVTERSGPEQPLINIEIDSIPEKSNSMWMRLENCKMIHAI